MIREFFNSLGYKQTLGAPRREVRFPLKSGRKFREFQKPRVLGLVTAPKRTPETGSPNVCPRT